MVMVMQQQVLQVCFEFETAFETWLVTNET
jgi:hypothetical protein